MFITNFDRNNIISNGHMHLKKDASVSEVLALLRLHPHLVCTQA